MIKPEFAHRRLKANVFDCFPKLFVHFSKFLKTSYLIRCKIFFAFKWLRLISRANRLILFGFSVNELQIPLVPRLNKEPLIFKVFLFFWSNMHSFYQRRCFILDGLLILSDSIFWISMNVVFRRLKITWMKTFVQCILMICLQWTFKPF